MNDETILQSKVPVEKSGHSLVDYLSGRFRYQTADSWRQLILQKKVQVNGKAALPEQSLVTGDQVAYFVQLNEPAVDDRIEIIHEEPSFLVAFKPGQLPSHADGNYIKNTFIYLLNDILKKKGWKGTAHLVHRLDRETSGLMIVAKEKKALSNLTLQFEKGQVEKEYSAIVRNPVKEEAWEVAGAIAKDPESQISIRQKTVAEGTPNSKSALTFFNRMKNFGSYALVQCRPRTGRTNQIRIHLAASGHPIAGDKLYGRSDEEYLHFVHSVKKGASPFDFPGFEANRQMLHAQRLTFHHPQTGENISFFSPLPQDMEEFIQNHSEARP